MRRSQRKPMVAVVSLVVVAGLAVAGCGGSGSGGGGGSSGPTIALLLPENQTARYETHDRPDFEARVRQLCSNCKILYSNATGDATKQQNDADAALTEGAKVLVLDPVDAVSAGSIVAEAKSKHVPVISYDRLVANSAIDYYISFDNVRVGRLQGQSLSAKLKAVGKPHGPIIMLNGDPTDSNAKQFKQGATSAFNANNVKIAKQYDTPGYTGSNAQNETQQAITALGNNGFAGIYGANDDIAGGAIAAMKSAGITPSTRPSTGQDASVAGLQRILTGDQYMTVYKAVTKEAQVAAEVAVALARGLKPPPGLATAKTKDGKTNVPSVLLTPVAVTKNNINATVIRDHFWTVPQICTSAFQVACRAAGIGGSAKLAPKKAAPAPTTPAPKTSTSTPPPTPSNGIPQNNGGDHDSDNNGGPSDGDGAL
jgi:D-xylose transport system substrate-binding protein